MITEVARLEITPGQNQPFESAVARALPYFKAAAGFGSLTLNRCIEDDNVYHLVVEWETLEHHTVHFRESEGFEQWRALASPFFSAPPQVIHTTHVDLPA